MSTTATICSSDRATQSVLKMLTDVLEVKGCISEYHISFLQSGITALVEMIILAQLIQFGQ